MSIVIGGLMLALLLLAAAMMPVGWMKGHAERQLSDRFDSPVRIGAVDREGIFSFRPVIRASDVHVSQPQWAGQGEMASIRLLRMRVNLLPLLIGRLDADLLTARGVRLNLARTADGRVNWRKDGGSRNREDGAGLEAVSVEDAVIEYRDAKQKRSATVNVRIDPAKGLTADGTGTVDGAPIRLRARGGPMAAGRFWAFDAAIEGMALNLHAVGSMAGPLRTDDMRFRMTARADDLKRIDRIIEAGLFGTQPVDLAAEVRHEGDTWTIEKLAGTIGSSELAGRLTARKTDGRTKLDGDVRFARLNFEDLASDEGNAKAVALERVEGLKIVPNTRINIRKIDKTDGRIRVRVDRVTAGRRPSSITDVQAVLTLDNRILTAEPLRLGLKQGAVTGKAIVDQRAGQAKPRVMLALDMTDSSISALAGGDSKEIDGRVDARVRLEGTGDTIREAVGHSDGAIGVTARAGSLPSRIAALIGFDVGKGLLGDDKGQTTLRCAAIKLDVDGGRGTINPLLVDTSVSQTRGSGTIIFPEEALAVALSGAPKGEAALRLPGTISVRGTIRVPEIVIPKESKSVGTIIKMIGRTLSGKSGPQATDADCGALTRAAIGR
ncbi:AsmA family protein [Sphingomonas sp. DBB INV C78]|uniref:AsmA family protein n=1 Tax=Sphingomonas sp. DBB INV C78 TaxID=3349434 RepID=UPI0036D3F833